MRGRPEEWRTLPPPGDILLMVKRELKDWAEKAVLAGVRRERIVLDPGFGFGKSFDENYPLLARFSELQTAGFPLLAGTSRKSFIGRTLARDGKDAPPEHRLYGTLATQMALILKGAHIVRTHDVKAAVEAARGRRDSAGAVKAPPVQRREGETRPATAGKILGATLLLRRRIRFPSNGFVCCSSSSGWGSGLRGSIASRCAVL